MVERLFGEFPRFVSIAVVTVASSRCAGNTYHYSMHKTRDETHGIVAYTCLIPSGWSASEKCVWGQQYGFVRDVSSPDHSCALSEIYNLSTPFQTIGGQAHQGTGAPPPSSLIALLYQNAQQTHPGVKFEVVKRTEKPISQSTASLHRANFGSEATLILHFTKNGTPYEICTTAELSGHDYGNGSGRFSVHSGFWTLDMVLGIEGPVSREKELTKDLVVLLSSNRNTAQFDQVDAQFSQQNLQNANNQIRLDGEISKRIAKNADDRENAIMGRASSGASSNYLDFLGNAETYRDPITNEEVQLSNGYKEAWTDGQGNYILSEDGSYDPNRGSSKTSWHRERKKS